MAPRQAVVIDGKVAAVATGYGQADVLAGVAELSAPKEWDETAHFAASLGIAWLVAGLVDVVVADRWGGVDDRQTTAGLVGAGLLAPEAEEAALVVAAAAGEARLEDWLTEWRRRGGGKE